MPGRRGSVRWSVAAIMRMVVARMLVAVAMIAAPRCDTVARTPTAILVAIGFIVAGVIADVGIDADAGDRAARQEHN